VVGVTALPSGDEFAARAETLQEAVADGLKAEAEWTATVGVGSAREALSDLRESYSEARRAIAIGRAVPGLEKLVRWDSLGAYRTLARLRYPGDGVAVPLPEPLERLLNCADAATLVPTLEEYLEHAGDARAAAAELYIHKSSLYQRLHRIEEIAQVDLSSGDDRLDLHMGLRLWRMGDGSIP
jgi:sugar diacid utilization regulator